MQAIAFGLLLCYIGTPRCIPTGEEIFQPPYAVEKCEAAKNKFTIPAGTQLQCQPIRFAPMKKAG